jgi:hypothetical protein
MSYLGTTAYGAADPAAQVTTGLIIIAVVFVTGFMAEGLLSISLDKSRRFKTLLDYTASSEESGITIRQDPKFSDAMPLGLSVNERTGIEFSYSFYMFILPSTFSGDQVMKHVFHKGYGVPWPLMGPGVFVMGNTNTMRVVMNTHKNPYTHTDIQNIPVQKWFHVVLNCFKGGLDIYINGTLANRIPFKDDVPYQNYQDLIFFSQTNHTLRKENVAALEADGSPIEIRGAFNGYISNMKYARYALSMVEIGTLMSEGPSSKRKTPEMAVPPYFADSWWTGARAT